MTVVAIIAIVLVVCYVNAIERSPLQATFLTAKLESIHDLDFSPSKYFMPEHVAYARESFAVYDDKQQAIDELKSIATDLHLDYRRPSDMISICDVASKTNRAAVTRQQCHDMVMDGAARYGDQFNALEACRLLIRDTLEYIIRTSWMK